MGRGSSRQPCVSQEGVGGRFVFGERAFALRRDRLVNSAIMNQKVASWEGVAGVCRLVQNVEAETVISDPVQLFYQDTCSQAGPLSRRPAGGCHRESRTHCVPGIVLATSCISHDLLRITQECRGIIPIWEIEKRNLRAGLAEGQAACKWQSQGKGPAVSGLPPWSFLS